MWASPQQSTGTTFFANISKLAKVVGHRIGLYLRARKTRIVQRSLRELFFHVKKMRKAKNVRERLSLQRKDERSEIQDRYYQDSLNAARNQVYAERMACMQYWKVLEHHNALPIDPRTREQWNDFDEFLARWSDDTAAKRKMFA